MLYIHCSFSASQPLLNGGWNADNEQCIYNIAHYLHLNHHFRKVFASPKWNLSLQMGYPILKQNELCIKLRMNLYNLYNWQTVSIKRHLGKWHKPYDTYTIYISSNSAADHKGHLGEYMLWFIFPIINCSK